MKYDVTIVGAGPAGSTTAKFLSEKGVNVLLIDKEKFPRDKPCGGGLPMRVLQRYPYVVNEKIIEAYSSSGTVFSPSLKYKVEANKNTPLIATTLRKKFDFELVKFAQEAGAVLQEEKNVTGVKILPDKARVILKDGTFIDSEIIVGADGVNSIIAKAAGLRKQGTKKGVCILQEFEVDEKIMDEYFKKSRHCYVHSRFKRISGYGWVFPKKEHLNIGFGAVQPSKYMPEHKLNLLECYHEYIRFLKEEGLIPKKLKETPIKGGALPTQPLEKTYADRIILVGDAAGFINPLSGEGIYYAMVSGEIAAGLIVEALQKKQTNEKFLSTYETRWKKDFGGDINLILKIVKRGKIEKRDRVFKIAAKDTFLTELMMGVITGELGVQKNKWKILRRFLYSSLKDRFHKE